MDFNKVTLSGQAISDPTNTTLRGVSKTPICHFLLQVNERFIDSDTKKWESRPSVFNIETLGNKAHSTFALVKKGMRIMVEGYMRSYGASHQQVAVRAFSVTKEEKHDAAHYYEGIEQSLETIRTCRDKDAAVDAIQSLLEEAKKDA